MQKQLDFVELAPHDRREERLRFMLDIVRPLYHAAQSHAHTCRRSQVAYNLPKKLTITYGSVLRTLVSVCVNAGNKRSAEIFLEELAALPRFVRSPEDEALLMQRLEAMFQARSISLRQSLRELEEHHNAAHALPTSAMFSPEHLKMLSSLPAETVVQLLLNYKEDAGRQDGLGRTDLHLAVEIGDSNLFRFIYERNKHLLHERDDFCMAPFQLAALMGNSEIFEALYNSETDKAAQDVFSRDALVLSSESGNDSVVKLLLDRGVNPNEGYDNSRCSPLFAAAGGGNHSTVSLLLSRNAYPLQLSFGQTPGSAAELYGHHEISRTLKDAEAKLSAAPGSQLLSDHTFSPDSCIWGRTNPGSPARFSSQNVIGAGVLPSSTKPRSVTPQALRRQVSPRISAKSPTAVTGAKIVSTNAVDLTQEATTRDQELRADGMLVSELGVASDFMHFNHDSPSLQTTSPEDVVIADESLFFEQWMVRSPLVEAVDTTAPLL
jgi:ankyrin repeat protein